MTIAFQTRPAAHVSRDFAVSDGHARARVQAPPAYLRRNPVGIDNTLRAASPANVLSMLSRTPLPDAFTPSQKHVVRYMLDEHHPQTLARSPVIDIDGNPMPLKLSSTPLSDVASGDVLPVTGKLEKGLVGLFTNYQESLRWQKDNIGIRTIRPGEAEPALTGQKGVFAKKDIAPGTPIGLFGGQLLADPAAVAFDEKIRTMAGLPASKYMDRGVSREGSILQGMSTLMKCNSAGEKANLFSAHVNTIGPKGETIRLMALFASEPIKAGQEMRMSYKV